MDMEPDIELANKPRESQPRLLIGAKNPAPSLRPLPPPPHGVFPVQPSMLNDSNTSRDMSSGTVPTGHYTTPNPSLRHPSLSFSSLLCCPYDLLSWLCRASHRRWQMVEEF